MDIIQRSEKIFRKILQENGLKIKKINICEVDMGSMRVAEELYKKCPNLTELDIRYAIPYDILFGNADLIYAIYFSMNYKRYVFFYRLCNCVTNWNI